MPKSRGRGKGDFGSLRTEKRNPRTRSIDAEPIDSIVRTIQKEDARVSKAVAAARGAIGRAVRLLVDRMQKDGRVFFVGAGTSGRLGVLEAAECPPTFDTPPRLVQAVMAGGPACVWASREGAEDDSAEGAREIRKRRLRKSDTVVGIAASGITPFVHGALGVAKRSGAGRILVTCNRKGVDRRAADVLVAVDVGPEVIAGSTRLKAGTATKMILNTLTVTTMIRLGKVYENLMVDLQPKSAKLHARARRILGLLTGVEEASADLALLAAGNRVKVAVVMLRNRVSREEAEALLRSAGGSLRQVIG